MADDTNFKIVLEIDPTILEEQIDDEFPNWSNRPGDAKPNGIFCEVGRALTRWERIEVNFLEILISFQKNPDNCNKIIRKYGRRRDTKKRVELLIKEYNKYAQIFGDIPISEQEFSSLLFEYAKWKIARNRLAHGEVIIAGPVMMDEIENGMISTYQLHPSQADQRSWQIPWREITAPNNETYTIEGDSENDYIVDGPIFSYRAQDIASISTKFRAMDQDTRKILQIMTSARPELEHIVSNSDYDNEDESL